MTVRLGILALLEAKAGKGEQLVAFLKAGRELAVAEQGTITWYAFKISDTTVTTTASTAVIAVLATRIRRRASARLRAAHSAAIRSRARSLACGPRCGLADLPHARP
jgi:hypothetical protein